MIRCSGDVRMHLYIHGLAVEAFVPTFSSMDFPFHGNEKTDLSLKVCVSCRQTRM